MAALPKKQWTAAEYLAFERVSEEKHEFVDGDVYLMTGASENHNLIVTNVIVALGIQLRDRPCKLYPSDMRVRVRNRGYFYPDVTVVCATAEFEDDEVDTLLNPTVIVEVLSPSTEGYDRGKKSQHYRALESLQEYVLISQEAPYVECYRRRENGQWLLSEAVGLEAALELPSIGCRLALSDVYAKVTFEDREGEGE